MSEYTASICKKISIIQVIACQDNLCELQVTEISFACDTGSSALCASCLPMRLTSAGRHEGNTADTREKNFPRQISSCNWDNILLKICNHAME